MERTPEQLKALLKQIYIDTADCDGYSMKHAINVAADYNIPEAEELLETIDSELRQEAYEEHVWMASYVRDAREYEREGDYTTAESIRKMVCS